MGPTGEAARTHRPAPQVPGRQGRALGGLRVL